jgi:hypothetical protein
MPLVAEKEAVQVVEASQHLDGPSVPQWRLRYLLKVKLSDVVVLRLRSFV